MPAAYRQLASQKGWLNTQRPLSADDLQGRVILLDFWTFCCINCMHIMPDLAALENTFGDKLTVIGVHSAKFKNEQDSENIRQAILRNDLHHPVVNDFNFSIWKAFDVHAWPTLVLLNPEGTIEHVYSGEGHRAEIERDVKELLDHYGKSVNTAPLPIALEKTKVPVTVLSFPTKIAYAADYPDRNVLFVADSGHHRIVAITTDGRIVASIGTGASGREDGEFDTASFVTPQGLAWQNQMLYIADTGSHLLRVADFTVHQVVTLAGTGAQGHDYSAAGSPALRTALASPWDIAFYPDSSHLAIANAGTHQLWQYDTKAKTLSVIAGNGREFIDDGAAPHNSLAQTSGVVAVGDTLYFVDAETSSLRMLRDGKVSTLIGSGLFDFGFKDGTKDVARMQHPLGITAGKDTVYIADSYNHSIRAYDIKSGVLSTLAGNGQRGNTDGAFAKASFNEPNDITFVEGKLFVADTNNQAIRVLDLATKTVSTLSVRQDQTLVDSFSDALPNLEKTSAVKVSDNGPLTVHLQLQDGWKVNKEAPSALALFAMKDNSHTVIARFEHDQILDKRVMLPKLAAGQYRLQGTLYYCETKEGAQCLLKSFDMQVTAGKSDVSDITLPLN